MPAPWDLPDREVTPEAAVLDRRAWLKSLGLGLGLGGLAFGAGTYWWWRRRSTDADVLAHGTVDSRLIDYYPARHNNGFVVTDRALSREADAARYCNFYEFTSSKTVWRYVEPFQPLPWTLEIGGLVANPRTYTLEDLHHDFPLEERIYRHRCVEAWAMVIPWTGLPLSLLFKKAEPLSSARYVRFTTFDRPEEAGQQRSRRLPWPYTESLTLAEATNELSFLATGMYGHPLLKQHGAPIRLVVPWKYGYKSAKSVVRIDLTAEQPATFWNTMAPEEYDFQANVEPDIPHPRWSQKNERLLGTGDVLPSRRFNGYGEWVAHLY
jgi:sulfoxide reductase catalytic subunit YedY